MFAGAAGFVTGRNRVMCDCCSPADKPTCADTMLGLDFQQMLLV